MIVVTPLVGVLLLLLSVGVAVVTALVLGGVVRVLGMVGSATGR